MKFSNCAHTLLVCIAIVGLLAPSAWPQASTATVSGTVRDQTGAVIPGASVALTQTAMNVSLKTTANETGFYFFPGVIPGPYKILVEAAGMQKFEGSLTVMVQQSAVVDVAMKVGQATTEVSVQDVTPQLQVDNPTLGHTLERTRIEQLPINGRSVSNLLQTAPGMEGLRAFGLEAFSDEIVLDGASIADREGWNSMIMRGPSLDSIQEFKVENNVSSAKFSRPTNVVLTSKTGTNELHGAAFETARNNAVGLARARTDYYTNPPFLNRHEFGVSAGGPVYLPKVYNGKNRTFWFFTYEAQRNRNATTYSFPVPTQAMRNGDMRGLTDVNGNMYRLYNPWTTDPNTWARQQFSYNGQLNVIDPALENPLAKWLLNLTTLPTTTDNPEVASNWYGPQSFFVRNWTTTARIDQRFGDKDLFYGRYTKGYNAQQTFYSSEQSLNWDLVPSGTQGYQAPNKSIAISWVHTFSPTFFNELLASGSLDDWWVGTGVKGKYYDDELGLPNPLHGSGWPQLGSGGLGSVGNGSFAWWTQSANGFNGFYGMLDDNATRIHGKHEFQFGFHFRYDQDDMLPQQQFTAGRFDWSTLATALYDPSTSRTNPAALPFTGENFGNLYLGVMDYSTRLNRNLFYGRQKEFAPYFQDNWRVTPRLTLNLGLRWEFWPSISEKNNAWSTFDPTNDATVLGQNLPTMEALGYTLPSIVNRLMALGVKFETPQQAGLPQNITTSTTRDLGPRLGFAYRVGEGRKAFVLRGGYRISYFHIMLDNWSATMRSNTPMTAQFYVNLTGAQYSPDGIANIGLRTVPYLPLAGTSTTVLDAGLNNAQSLTPGSASLNFLARQMPDPRIQDWNLTVEKEVMSNTVVRASYIGNHSAHLDQLYQFNGSTPTYIWYMTTGLPVPTGSLSAVATNYFDRTVYGSLNQWQNTGWGNSNGISLEMERRYSKGYGWQVFYVMDNNFAAGGQGYSGSSVIPEINQYLPGQVPADQQQRNYLLNYQRDTTTPHHRVRWNWIVDLPFGKGKPLLGNAGRMLDRLVGGWQVAGLGSLNSTYFTLPTNYFPTNTPIQIYGYKYPIQNCTSGTCYPGYLWWNGYIPANLINSHNPVTGKPNGYEGIPANYHPAVQPLWPYPANYASLNSSIDPLYAFYGGNTVWVPISNGTVQRTTWAGLPALRNQYFPSVRQWGTDASLVKNIAINERFNLRLSGDFFNVFNCPGNPNSVASTGIESTQSSGNSPRTLQLAGRLSW